MSKRVEISLPSGRKAFFLLNDSSHVISDFDSSKLSNVPFMFRYDDAYFYYSERDDLWYVKCDDNSKPINITEHVLDLSLDNVDDVLFGNLNEGSVRIIGKNEFKDSPVKSASFNEINIFDSANNPSSNLILLQDIPDNLVFVDSRELMKFTKLKEYSFSDKVKDIGYDTFSFSKLKNVIFSEGLRRIGTKAFCGSSLVDVVIPNSVFEIGKAAFCDCDKLNSFTFPMHLSEIPSLILSRCKNLKNVSFPIDCKIIWNCAFEDCEKLNFDLFSDTIEYIGECAFKNCKSLGPDSLFYIDTGSNNDTFMTDCCLPKNLKVICAEAFAGCINLSLASDFPENLEYIGDRAFYGTNLFRVNLPRNIRGVGKDAFEGCKYLNIISYYGIPIYGEKIYFYDKTEFIDNFFSNILGDKSKIRFDALDSDYDIADTCSDILRSSIFNFVFLGDMIDKEKLFDGFIKKFDYNIFKKNVTYLMDLGFDKQNVVDLITNGCYSISSVSLENAFNNFEYLTKQKIIDSNLLELLYFSNIEGNNVKEKFKNYCSLNKKFPDLFNTLLVEDNDKSKLELRDRLIYVATMQFLDGNYDNLMFCNAVSMLKRTLFSNIVERDQFEINKVSLGAYDNIKMYSRMAGIMMPLYKKLNGIDSNWFLQFIEEMNNKSFSSLFYKFYSSLNVCNGWEQYSDEVERATLLKNEIVGRLLYADIALTLDGLKLKSGDYYNKYVELKRQGKSVSVKELLEYAKKPRYDLFKNTNIINVMLKIDPYSFDALRVQPKDMRSLHKDDVQVKFAGIAKTHGYLFEDAEIDIYTKLRNYAEFESDKRVKNYADFVNNSVGLAKIPNEDKERYLMRIKKMARAYVENQDDNDLFSMCRSLDLYLRNNQIFDRNDDDVEKTAKVVFDRDSKISNDARILYCLYNLNRLAHDTYELNTKAAIKLNFRLATSNIVDEKKLNDVFSAYNYLYSCGFDSDKVRSLLKDKNESLFKEYSDLSDEEKNEVLSGLNFFRKKDIRSKKISEDELTEIRKKLILIDSLNDKESELINSSIEEQNIFFECKRLFSEEIMNRMVGEFSNDFIKMFEASDDEKVKFYAENGYIVEVQDSSGGPTLVCLCNVFNEPFSIHLKDLPDEISNALDNAKRGETIAHCSLDGKGITLRDSDFEKDLLNNTDSADNFAGFKKGFVGVRLPQAIRSNFDRYDVPAAHYIAKKNEFNNMFENENSSNAALGDAYSKK